MENGHILIGEGRGTFSPTAFWDERAVPAILEDTRDGKMPSRIFLAGGPDLEEEELEGFSLQVQGEDKEGTGLSPSEEEDGPGPPL